MPVFFLGLLVPPFRFIQGRREKRPGSCESGLKNMRV